MAEQGEDSRWLTYDELAEARGIDRQSARRLASRLKWRRQQDNRQTIRVLVPEDWAERPPRTRGSSADMSRAVAALEAAVTTLREQLGQANSRAEAAARERETAERLREAATARADALRDELKVLLAEREADRERAARADKALREVEATLATRRTRIKSQIMRFLRRG